MSVPSYLADTFHKRMAQVRKEVMPEIRAAFDAIKDPVKGSCYDCGRTTKTERADAEAYGKYAFSCMTCCLKSAVDTAAADLAEQMSVC